MTKQSILMKLKKMLGYETDWAMKQRQYREQKQLSNDVLDTLSPPCPLLSDKR